MRHGSCRVSDFVFRKPCDVVTPFGRVVPGLPKAIVPCKLPSLEPADDLPSSPGLISIFVMVCSPPRDYPLFLAHERVHFRNHPREGRLVDVFAVVVCLVEVVQNSEPCASQAPQSLEGTRVLQLALVAAPSIDRIRMAHFVSMKEYEGDTGPPSLGASCKLKQKRKKVGANGEMG